MRKNIGKHLPRGRFVPSETMRLRSVTAATLAALFLMGAAGSSAETLNFYAAPSVVITDEEDWLASTPETRAGNISEAFEHAISTGGIRYGNFDQYEPFMELLSARYWLLSDSSDIRGNRGEYPALDIEVRTTPARLDLYRFPSLTAMGKLGDIRVSPHPSSVAHDPSHLPIDLRMSLTLESGTDAERVTVENAKLGIGSGNRVTTLIMGEESWLQIANGGVEVSLLKLGKGSHIQSASFSSRPNGPSAAFIETNGKISHISMREVTIAGSAEEPVSVQFSPETRYGRDYTITSTALRLRDAAVEADARIVDSIEGEHLGSLELKHASLTVGGLFANLDMGRAALSEESFLTLTGISTEGWSSEAERSHSLNSLTMDANSALRLAAPLEGETSALLLRQNTALAAGRLNLEHGTTLVAKEALTLSSPEALNLSGAVTARELVVDRPSSETHFSALTIGSAAAFHSSTLIDAFTLTGRAAGDFRAETLRIENAAEIEPGVEGAATREATMLGDVTLASDAALTLRAGAFRAAHLRSESESGALTLRNSTLRVNELSLNSPITLVGTSALRIGTLEGSSPLRLEIVNRNSAQGSASESAPLLSIDRGLEDATLQLNLTRSTLDFEALGLEALEAQISRVSVGEGALLTVTESAAAVPITVERGGYLTMSSPTARPDRITLATGSTLEVDSAALARFTPLLPSDGMRLLVRDSLGRHDALLAALPAGPHDIVLAQDEATLAFSSIASSQKRLGTLGALTKDRSDTLTLSAAGSTLADRAVGFVGFGSTDYREIVVGDVGEAQGPTLSVFGMSSASGAAPYGRSQGLSRVMAENGALTLASGTLQLGLMGAARQGALPSVTALGGAIVVEGGAFRIDDFVSDVKTQSSTYNWYAPTEIRGREVYSHRSALEALTLAPNTALTLTLTAREGSAWLALAEENRIAEGAHLTLELARAQSENASTPTLLLGNVSLAEGASLTLLGSREQARLFWRSLTVAENARVDLSGASAVDLPLAHRAPLGGNYDRASVQNRGDFRLGSGALDQYIQLGENARAAFGTLDVEDLNVEAGSFSVENALTVGRRNNMNQVARFGAAARVFAKRMSLGVPAINYGEISGLESLVSDETLTNYGQMRFADNAEMRVKGLKLYAPLSNLARLEITDTTLTLPKDVMLEARDRITLWGDFQQSSSSVKGKIRTATLDLRTELRQASLMSWLFLPDVEAERVRLGSYEEQSSYDSHTQSVQRTRTHVREDVPGTLFVVETLKLAEDELDRDVARGYIVSGGRLALGSSAFYDLKRDEVGQSTLLLGKRLALAAGSFLHVGMPLRWNPSAETLNQFRFFADGTSLTVVDARLVSHDERALITALDAVASSPRAERSTTAAAPLQALHSTATLEGDSTALSAPNSPIAPIALIEPVAKLLITQLPRRHGRIVLLGGFQYHESMVRDGFWVGGWSGADALRLESAAGIPYLVNTYWEQPEGSLFGNFVIDPIEEDFDRLSEVYPNIVIPKNFREALERGSEGEQSGHIDQDFLFDVAYEPSLSVHDKEEIINSAAQLSTLMGVRAQTFAAATRAANSIAPRLSTPEHGSHLWARAEGGLSSAKDIAVAGGMRGGFQRRDRGVSVGADRALGAGLAGAAFTVLDANAESRGDGLAATERSRFMALQLYAALRASERARLLASAGAFRAKSALEMALPMGFKRATASVTLSGYWLNARAEMDFSLGTLTVTPHVGARFIQIGDGEYPTKISDRAAWDNRERATRTWQFPIGLSIAAPSSSLLGWSIAPSADFTLTMHGGARSTSTHVVGRTLAVHDDVPARFAPRTLMDMSVGLTAKRGAWEAASAYSWGAGGFSRNEHRLTLELSWAF